MNNNPGEYLPDTKEWLGFDGLHVNREWCTHLCKDGNAVFVGLPDIKVRSLEFLRGLVHRELS